MYTSENGPGEKKPKFHFVGQGKHAQQATTFSSNTVNYLWLWNSYGNSKVET